MIRRTTSLFSFQDTIQSPTFRSLTRSFFAYYGLPGKSDFLHEMRCWTNPSWTVIQPGQTDVAPGRRMVFSRRWREGAVHHSPWPDETYREGHVASWKGWGRGKPNAMPSRIVCNGVNRESVKARSDLASRLFFLYHYTKFDMASPTLVTPGQSTLRLRTELEIYNQNHTTITQS